MMMILYLAEIDEKPALYCILLAFMGREGEGSIISGWLIWIGWSSVLEREREMMMMMMMIPLRMEKNLSFNLTPCDCVIGRM
jgi:hypothetical protein